MSSHDGQIMSSQRASIPNAYESAFGGGGPDLANKQIDAIRKDLQTYHKKNNFR